MKAFTRILLFSVFTGALAGCSRPTGAGSASTAATGSGPIPVGEYASMTGDTATFGQSSHKGVQMAIDEINTGGGINGRQLALDPEDDQSKAPEAAAAWLPRRSANEGRSR